MLNNGERTYKLSSPAMTRNREIFERPLRMDTVIRIPWNRRFTQCIRFNTHSHDLPLREIPRSKMMIARELGRKR